MHNRVSGVSDYLAEDELDGIRIARDIMKHVKVTTPHIIPEGDVQEPIYESDEILSVVSANSKTPFDIRELIMRIIDGLGSTATKWASLETMVLYFLSQLIREHSLSNYAIRMISQSCLSKILQDIWSVKPTKKAVSLRMVPS